MEFTSIVFNSLSSSGWYNGRNIDTSVCAKIIRDEGYPWLLTAQKFLAEFADLSVVFNNEGIINSFNFNIKAAIDNFDSRWIFNDYADRIGVEYLCPVGIAYGSHMLLFVDKKGLFYGGYDDYLAYIGSNKIEFIENLCLAKMQEI